MSGLKLSYTSEKLAVCKFPPQSKPPSWIFDEGNAFCSLTRTKEELSVVCPQELVPPEEGVQKCESDWSCLKVEGGPLDFSLTGILSSLAHPLAEAGISIFAISTYNTDYVLVKHDQLDKAISVLKQAGSTIIIEPQRDDPALSFEIDPLVAPLVETNHPETFGLVLVAGWPPVSDFCQNYQDFIAAVRTCFDQADIHGALVPVYLYPSSALHVTIATFRRINKQTGDTTYEGSFMTRHAKIIVQRAMQSKCWPKQSLQFVVDQTQIDKRAGILLYKETTGGMEAMRTCIQNIANDYLEKLPSMGLLENEQCAVRDMLLKDLAIPSIIHTTFLRFYQMPMTSGETIQQRFQERIKSKISSFFPTPIPASSATLVCERRPYMHIPRDERHVLVESDFSSADTN